MNLADLMPFCAAKTDRHRAALWEPWSEGEYTFATDAKVIIKVPRLAEVPERADAPKRVEEELFAKRPPRSPWFMMPELPPVEMQTCTRCKGTAIAYLPCEKCEGEGQETCEACGHDHDCPACKGDGEVKDNSATPKACPHCTSGQHPKEQFAMCGENKYNTIFLRRIAQLPSVVFSETQNSPTEFGPLAFRFNEGEGRLMPVRL